MTPAQNVANPFALMMDPESVLAAIAGSERLARLKSRICRPLDKVVAVPATGDADAGALVDESAVRRNEMWARD